MIDLVRGLAALMAAGAAAGLAGGFLGAVHPAGDSLAVFRSALAAALLALSAGAALLGMPRLGLAGAVFAVAGAATLIPHWRPGAAAASGTGPGRELTHYQKNLWVRLPDADPVAADILDAAPDLVTLQEVRDRGDPVIARLAAAYPTVVQCPYTRVGGVAVLSRFPAVPGTILCQPGSGVVAVVLDTPAGPVRAVSIHLHWPWPCGQPAQIGAILGALGPFAGPTVIGGDFNMVRWSHALRRIAAATGTAPVGPSRVTLRGKRGVLNLSIDHVLAPGGQGSAELRPRLGSDHDGVLARIVLAE